MKHEIRLAHIHIETPLIISENQIQTLIIENPSEFYSMVDDLDRQFDGLSGTFVFSADGEIIPAEKYGVLVCDPFHFDLNDKKILNLLYKILERNAFESGYMPKFNKLAANITEFLEDLTFSVPFALSYDEPQPIELFKTIGVKFEKAYDSLEEKIICYINALIELKKCEFFVFIDLKSVLNDEKIISIFNHCQEEKVGLLLIESAKRRKTLPCENTLIITCDLCEIVGNQENRDIITI